MESIARSKRRSHRLSLPGLLLMIAAGVGSAVAAGIAAYLVSELLRFGIPMLIPAFLGLIAGGVTTLVGSGAGRCRVPAVAVGVPVVAAIVAWSTVHVADYVHFRLDAHRSITAEAPYADRGVIDYAIEEWLRDETGQPGLAGFMLLKLSSESIELSAMYGGFIMDSLRLEGAGLALYWVAELAVATGLAGLLGRSYPANPYCELCGAWRKYRTIVVGSVEQIDQAARAIERRDVDGAVRALGAHTEGDVARLELSYCPDCHADSRAALVHAQDAGETTVWSDLVGEAEIDRLLAAIDAPETEVEPAWLQHE